MSEHANENNVPAQTPLLLPKRSLIVLCGPAGSGKSTFAKKVIERHQSLGLKASAVVSSDACRLLVCDDEMSTKELVQRSTMEIFYAIIRKRMLHGCLTIADSLWFDEDARRAHIELAKQLNYSTCLIVFDLPSEICLAQNHQPDRTHHLPDDYILGQVQYFQSVLQRIPHEGWDQVCFLGEYHRELAIEIRTD